MFARVQNITNVVGRENYLKNKENREEVAGFYNTASPEFWKLLAKENQEQFLRSTNSRRANTKVSEAREIVLGLPSYVSDETSARILAGQVKNIFGVECMVAIHKKYSRNDEGEKVLNVHAHILFAERKLLDEPIVVEEKRASRTYYYDAQGKKCKKSEAVKVTPKGSITQEACTRYFSDKINFFNFKTLEPLINTFVSQFQFEKFDVSKHFPQRHIGAGNPKEKCIREYNALVKEMNSFFDAQDAAGSAQSAKEIFCEKFSVSQRFGVNKTEEIRNKFEQFKAALGRSEEVDLRFDIQSYLAEQAELEEDIKKAEIVLQTDPSDFVGTLVAKAHRNELEEKYHCRVDKNFLQRLKDKLAEVVSNLTAAIKKLQLAGHNEKTNVQQGNPAARSEQEYEK